MQKVGLVSKENTTNFKNMQRNAETTTIIDHMHPFHQHTPNVHTIQHLVAAHGLAPLASTFG